MSKIKFSYIFDDALERVYQCFTNIAISTGIIFKDIVTNLKFTKGERFDEENSEFTAIFKNYYQLKMIVENVKNETSFRGYTNRTLYIDKIPSELSLIFNFYWNSINENTIFILELIYDDEFFGDLFKTEFNINDKVKVCTNAKNYLNSIIKGLENTQSVLINSSLENIWSHISHPKKLFSILFKEFTISCKDEEISLDTEILITAKTSNSPNPIPLIKLVSEGLIASSNFCKMIFITSEKLSIPNQRIIFVIKMLNKTKTFFSVNIKILECITHEQLVSIRKLWKKKIIEFVNFFEAKNKK